MFGGLPTKWALPIAVAFEAFWEVLENSPMIIDRYRAVTISWGYSGDSILNSMSDISWMVIGFLLASRIAGVGQRGDGGGARAVHARA